MKRKLLIIVGAGASIDFGLPSCAAIDSLFAARASKTHPLADTFETNLYCHIRDRIDAYYAGNPKLGLRKYANFEEVLYQINLLATHLSDRLRLHAANALLTAHALPDVLNWNAQRQRVDGNVLLGLSRGLVDALVDRFIDACAIAQACRSREMALLREFMTELQQRFEIGILTLNYDNLLTQALPNLHTGFDADGRFDSLSVLDRTEWSFIYHLHGSIHFCMTGGGADMHAITWTPTPTKNSSVQSAVRNTRTSIEGVTYPISPFIAGLGKSFQLLRQPFRTYFAQTQRLLQHADALLFLGYGFMDLHLNALFSEIRDRQRPIVVVDWAADSQDALPFREDEWSHHLSSTLITATSRMRSSGHCSPACVAELKHNHQLEVSPDPNRPLAIWYNGMLEACKNPHKILTHL